MDEHSELQLEFNSQDKKLKELQYENDRLVIDDTQHNHTTTHTQTVKLYW